MSLRKKQHPEEADRGSTAELSAFAGQKGIGADAKASNGSGSSGGMSDGAYPFWANPQAWIIKFVYEDLWAPVPASAGAFFRMVCR